MNEWVARDKKVVWHPFTPLEGVDDPLAVVRGKGAYLITEEGREILDAVGSWWVNIHGHGHPVLAQALSDQAHTLEHVIFAGFTHPQAVILAERLVARVPGAMERVFFSDNGSTAVEVGLKMALQYWHNRGIPRTKIIAMEGAYHGDTFGAMSVGGRSPFTAAFDSLLFEVHFLDFPDSQNQEKVISQMKQWVSRGDVAAFIYEPLVQGAAGMRMYAPEILESLMHIAREGEVLCLADEVFTGFGRTGRWFASEYLSLHPDIIALSKGITGGTMPLGVTLCNAQVAAPFHTSDRLKTFFHGHSYTANPLACAVANASLTLLEADDCQAAIERISAIQSLFVQRVIGRPGVKDARSLGTIMALELEAEGGTSYFHARRDGLYRHFLAQDILLRPLGNVLYMVPPYVMAESDLVRVHAAIEHLLADWV
jgi:adenosylmethionine---8-amino-7-oxononanoate aminotransferase